VSDVGELLTLVQEIVSANPGQADDFRAGKTKLMGFFVGQLMQKTKGQANPKLANELFLKELGG
jgi:aspartyl-tRNA(Asn)/glutamyl-tRNA(Gln) amidotransferase subunit B